LKKSPTHYNIPKTMPQIAIDLPEDLFSARRLPPEDFVRDLRLAAAIYWYQKRELSQEKAAQIAGLNRRDFLAALAREQVDVFAVDFDDLQRELDRD
jgi:predicted HTH domain antitoxin